MANAIEDEHYSPIRKIRVTGTGAGDFFDRLLTRPVSELPAMRAMYTVFCNEDGSLKDDAILYKFAWVSTASSK